MPCPLLNMNVIRWYTLKNSMNEYDKATAMRNQVELLLDPQTAQ